MQIGGRRSVSHSGSARSALVGILALLLTASAVHAEALVFHATQSGRQTLDQGAGGGNPFASAFVELLQRKSLTLLQLRSELQHLTAQKSGGFQSADVPPLQQQKDMPVLPPRGGERRIALVLVVSDYSRSGGAKSLPGAAHDAGRLASALRQAGFATEVALDRGMPAMREALAAFKRRSADADMAVVYTTGHGVETGGSVFLIPGDYPIAERNAALVERALPLKEIARSLNARRANLVFYGGCRDDPLGP